MFKEIVSRKEIKNTYTLKVYPYLKDPINRTMKKLNKYLFQYFDYDEISEALFGEFRNTNVGFNHSLTLEFLIELFKLLENKEDVRLIIFPELERFLKKKKKIEVVDKREKEEEN
jgi:hypothetical protein